ncbi:unnamed protein product, partial [Mesorhabditis belari]|uniref:Uncharacterized protein n=1 Tax=Mesorhabditis belari TaxID=2138241 RepID=A0AAF3EWU6_9BILA
MRDISLFRPGLYKTTLPGLYKTLDKANHEHSVATTDHCDKGGLPRTQGVHVCCVYSIQSKERYSCGPT